VRIPCCKTMLSENNAGNRTSARTVETKEHNTANTPRQSERRKIKFGFIDVNATGALPPRQC
jgi:hypothetical protein